MLNKFIRYIDPSAHYFLREDIQNFYSYDPLNLSNKKNFYGNFRGAYKTTSTSGTCIHIARYDKKDEIKEGNPFNMDIYVITENDKIIKIHESFISSYHHHNTYPPYMLDIINNNLSNLPIQYKTWISSLGFQP